MTESLRSLSGVIPESFRNHSGAERLCATSGRAFTLVHRPNIQALSYPLEHIIGQFSTRLTGGGNGAPQKCQSIFGEMGECAVPLAIGKSKFIAFALQPRARRQTTPPPCQMSAKNEEIHLCRGDGFLTLLNSVNYTS